MLNMESASAGAAIAGLSKTLTTPFSINDILTRSKPRRVSDSELQPRAGSKSPPSQPPLCCRDLSMATGSNPGQQSSYLQYYAAAAALDNNNPAAAASTSTSNSSNSASNTAGLPVDYVQRKLGYFGAALSAAALPLDMRRCNAASNDSGKLHTPLFRLMDAILLLQLQLLCFLLLCANFLFFFLLLFPCRLRLAAAAEQFALLLQCWRLWTRRFATLPRGQSERWRP